MDARQAILERRTAHLWKSPDEGGAVPDVVVKRALEAAHSAPCHKFTWPWGFVWAGPETRAEIFDLGVSLKCPNKAPSPRVLEKLTAKMKNPAHSLIVPIVFQRWQLEAVRFESSFELHKSCRVGS